MKKSLFRLILCLCLTVTLIPFAVQTVFAAETVDVITDYGAVGDGVTDDRAAIQAAIDAVHAAGGGTVTLTAGKTFLSGNIVLRSNVELHFGDGAVLKQNPDQGAYVKPSGDTLVSYTPERGHNTISGVRWGHSFYKSYPYVYAGEGTTNVSITGKGTIEMTPETKCADTIHMCPVGMFKVNGFVISDITITRSSAYGMMPFSCTNGLIQNVTMHNFVSSTPDVAEHLNGDGISLQNCQNIRVTGCNLSVTDDAIYVFTSYNDPRGGTWWNSSNPQPSTNIEIDHNTTNTTCKGFGFILWGSSCPDQYKVEVSNVYVHDNTFSSMGIWNDDPFDNLTVPTPIKNIRFENNTIRKIQDNFYATPIADMNLYPSMREFMNNGFESREIYWSSLRNTDSSSVGTSTYKCGQDGTYFGYIQKLTSGAAELYQGLYLETKQVYSFSAKVMTAGNTAQLFVRNLDTQEIVASLDFSNTAWEEKSLSFYVPEAGNYQLGIRSDASTDSKAMARIDSVSLTSTPFSDKSIFTTQLPNKTGSDNVYELGTRFKTFVNGRITKVRLYTDAAESGIHTVRIWDYSGKTLLAGPYEWDVPAGITGWQEYTLPTAVSIQANKDYVVAISNNADNKVYVQGTNADNNLASPVSNGYLVTYAKSGLWFRGTGSMPYNQTNTNYFRDVVFEADEQVIFTSETPTGYGSDTYYELGTRFCASKSGFVIRVRIYTNGTESGIHTVRIWDQANKTLVAGPYEWDVPTGSAGWKEFTLPEAVAIAANTDYVVAVSNNASNKLYAKGDNGLTAPIQNGCLTTYASSGLWSRNVGEMPYNKATTNYFRDVVFVLDSIDRSALQAAVTTYKNTSKGSYTDSSWNAFQTALANAQEVLSDRSATQTEVNNAANALNAAGKALATTKVVSNPTIVVEPGEFTYDGTAKNPTVTVKDGDTAIPASEYSLLILSNTNAGSATVMVSDKLGGDYEVEGNTTFTIHPASVTITTDSKSATVGDSVMPELTWQVTGFIGSDKLTKEPTVTCNGDLNTAGEYDIVASGAEAGSNYTITYVTGKLTVKAVDNSALTDAIAEAEKLSESDYTADSWTAFAAILADAKKTADNENATAETIQAAVKALTEAQEALVKVKVVDAPAITLDKSSYVYDGSEKKPAVTVKDGSTVIPASEYTVSYSNNRNAGTATVTVTDNSGGSYKVSGTATFAIKPAAVTVTADNKSAFIGDEQLPELTYQVKGLLGSDQLTNEPALKCAADLTAVGDFDIVASGADAGSNYTITYVKGKLTVNEVDKSALQTLVDQKKELNKDDYTAESWVTFQKVLTSSEEVLANKNATPAQIKDAISALTNASNALVKIRVVTNPVIALEKYSFVYSAAEQKPAVTVKDGNTVIDASEYTVSYSNNLNAGTATVTITDKTGGSYNVSGSTVFTIVPATVTVTADDKTAYVGDEKLPELTYQVKGLLGSDKLTTEPTLKCITDLTVVGDFNITASGADAGGNYTVSYVSGKLTVKEVDKADLQKLVDDNANTTKDGYTAESWDAFETAMAEARNVLDNKNATASQIRAAMEKLSAAAAGLEEIVVVNNPTITLEKTTFTYNGKAHTPAVTVKSGDIVIPASSYFVTYSNNINAGTATVTVTPKTRTVYSVSGTATFTITPAVVTVSADNKSCALKATMPKLTYKVTGLCGSDKLTREPTLKCSVDMEKAGTYAITVSGAEAGSNYTIQYANGILTVSTIPPTGDPMTLVLFGTMLLVSFSAIVLLMKKRKFTA